ncbi:tyrosine-protein phosphatase [Prescottella sp. R16]|uniref:tyrosine-protein phosphatase n=1 Tax=Prescottella sp. R16 TaxID=3064529 RepID=UPI00272EC070|nr:tyrosine-protein phosphatase [Prescottella sp. R16]
MKPGPTAESAPTRQFTLQGAHNVRDLGGYATTDGRSTVWGRVFRAGSLSALTADDVRALEGAGVGTVVDFRGADEIAKAGPDMLPAGVARVDIPLLDESTQLLSEAIQSAMATGNGTAMEKMLGNGRAQRIGYESFVDQLGKPETMAGYAETLRLIANSDDALVFHCTAGKDRTGMMAALLLGLLGVPDETIVDDFVLSNEYNRERNDKTYAFLSGKGVDVELVRPLTEQSPGKIRPVLEAVHDRYGGWDEFAATVLGLDPATPARLRDTLLTRRAFR